LVSGPVNLGRGDVGSAQSSVCVALKAEEGEQIVLRMRALAQVKGAVSCSAGVNVYWSTALFGALGSPVACTSCSLHCC
jgi:hypothetical protein